MPEPSDAVHSSSSKITAEDLVDFLQGGGAPEVNERVRAVIERHDPEVQFWLQGVSTWAHDSLPTARWPVAGVDQKLSHFLSFVVQQRIDRILPSESLDQVLESGWTGGALDKATVAQKEAALARMVDTLTRHAPDVAHQWESRARSRSR